ncbi:1,3-beta-glucan synthase component GLS1 [Cladochytrium replicatum]|nr:1,3-beta-glucan synthase component GLS1 [Cladochytrium replicatum]
MQSRTSSTPGEDPDLITVAEPKAVPDEKLLLRNFVLPSSQPPPPPEILDAVHPDLGGFSLEEVFADLAARFGFQNDNMRNQLENFTLILDSRMSRMDMADLWIIALISLHADYIGGLNANYKQWRLSVLPDTLITSANVMTSGPELSSCTQELESQIIDYAMHHFYGISEKENRDFSVLEDLQGAQAADWVWKHRMLRTSMQERARQIALWLMIWGEAANLRLIPELLSFLFMLADDHFVANPTVVPEGACPGQYLQDVVKPLYECLRDQSYKFVDGKLVKKEKDHSITIGYDDVNELFWTSDRLARILLKDGKSKLMDLKPEERWIKLKKVQWKRAFFKTFKERRTGWHLISNFSRIWILHLGFFYSYIAWTLGPVYAPQLALLEPATNFRWTVTGWGGLLMTLFSMMSLFIEASFLPISRQLLGAFFRRFGFLVFILLLNILPTPYVILYDRMGMVSSILSAVQMVVSVLTILFLSIMTPGALGVKIGNPLFSANFAKMKPIERALSSGMWTIIFVSKLVESLFFLVLPVGKPFQVLWKLKFEECERAETFCVAASWIAMALLVFLLLVLFFLDTYMWFILWSTALGVARSLYLGLSILTPWRNIFSRLPERLCTKLFASSDSKVKVAPKAMCAQTWNAICVALFEDHQISLECLWKMLYRKLPGDGRGRRWRTEKPKFFIAQEDVSTKMEFFPVNSEAERRFTFFAQSMSMVLPEPMPVKKMPCFSVLTPHYAEKILLSLREVIREHDGSTVTLLEYLKSLHSHEWENFVNDTKMANLKTTSSVSHIAVNAIGFDEHSSNAILRTRIWASLRSQTLYRTASGFMNYPKALKYLQWIEDPPWARSATGHRCLIDLGKLDDDLPLLIARKFRYVIAMQRYAEFTPEERADVGLLMRIYPSIQIAYLEREIVQKDGEEEGPYEKVWFSKLIDGHSTMSENGSFIPKYRIQLPGPPILGDGKSDNQNHAITFCRGEFLQLIDANQDNYLEEALKVRSIFSEFEPTSLKRNAGDDAPPVAIVGGSEFPQGRPKHLVLGDVAAGKEYTFGTISQRTTAKLQGRLHYGHPDFLNTIFMTTRGGVSKAQKGLHLNEDIYAGMSQCMLRGARIKHTEYIQCGKGRDLGFSSILKFVAKIGAGMGEQILSREHYYLGSSLPFDRCLTFFYSHPGFHLNNIFIILSLHLFLAFLLVIAALRQTLIACDKSGLPIEPTSTDLETEDHSLSLSYDHCADFDRVLDWVYKATLAIVVVFVVTFIPLFLQILTEQGIRTAVIRITKQILSLSPLFDVFTTQIYNYTLLYDLSFGRAGYIATGRGFATARNHFYQLFEAFAEPSIYVGLRMLACLVCVTITMPFGHLAFFWIVVLPLCIAPFLFNPHQFMIDEFLLDYRRTLQWFSAGNGKPCDASWIAFHQRSRVQITGNKRRMLGQAAQRYGVSGWKFSDCTTTFASLQCIPNFWLQQFITPTLMAVIAVVLFGIVTKSPRTAILLFGAAISPLLINAGILLLLFPITLLFGPCVGCCCTTNNGFGTVLAATAHTLALLIHILCFLAIGLFSDWHHNRLLFGVVAFWFAQRLMIGAAVTALPREQVYPKTTTNVAWWTGAWCKLGPAAAMSQPFREFACKSIELTCFASDFCVAHALIFALFPLCLVPFVDRWHTVMLFWTYPKADAGGGKGGKPMSVRQRRLRMKQMCCYGLLLVLLMLLFVGVLTGITIVKIPVGNKLVEGVLPGSLDFAG